MTVYFDDFRKTGNDSLDLFEALEYCRKAGAERLVFSKDTYDFTDECAKDIAVCVSNHGWNGYHRAAFVLEGMHDFEIDGGGSMFLLKDVMNLFIISECERITIGNFSVHMPYAPYPEGRITEADKDHVRVEFDYAGDMVLSEGRIKVMFNGIPEEIFLDVQFHPETHELVYGLADHTFGRPLGCFRIEEAGKNAFIIHNPDIVPKAGDIYIAVTGKRYSSCIFVQLSKDITVRDVTVHSVIGMGLIAQSTENITVDGMTVTAIDGMMVSSKGDATHFVACRGLVTVKNSLFRHMLDDALNIHGIYTKIIKSRPGYALVKFMHVEAKGIPIYRIGDRVCELDPGSLIPRQEAVIRRITVINGDCTALEFEDGTCFSEGNVVENLTAYPELIFENNTVENNRARGMLIATRKHAEIRGNTFHTAGSAILLECDGRYWYESGAVRDLVITKNNFTGCCYGLWGNSVVMIPPRFSHEEGKIYHGRIEISDNIFDRCHMQAVDAHDVEELVVENNVIL